jgi:hypothetical protein
VYIVLIPKGNICDRCESRGITLVSSRHSSEYPTLSFLHLFVSVSLPCSSLARLRCHRPTTEKPPESSTSLVESRKCLIRPFNQRVIHLFDFHPAWGIPTPIDVDGLQDFYRVELTVSIRKVVIRVPRNEIPCCLEIGIGLM